MKEAMETLAIGAILLLLAAVAAFAIYKVSTTSPRVREDDLRAAEERIIEACGRVNE